VQRSGDARGDCVIGCPYQSLILSSGEYSRLFVTSQYDVIFKFATNVLAKFVDQARNQLWTPGGAKSFLREAQIFRNMCNIFILYPTHFSRGDEKFSRGGFAPAGIGLVVDTTCVFRVAEAAGSSKTVEGNRNL